MNLSVFDMFKVGIGPSSSHTVGPMRAAYAVINQLRQNNTLDTCARVVIELYGSLALTGLGHGTDSAILMGLESHLPESIDPAIVQSRVQAIKQTQRLQLTSHHAIHFDYATDLIWHKNQTLTRHTNGMRFSAFDAKQQCLLSEEFFSIGGGFIESSQPTTQADTVVPYPFKTAHELWHICQTQQLSIADVMRLNEQAFARDSDLSQDLLAIADIMQRCVDHGLHSPGILPGGLNVMRRAPQLLEKLQQQGLPIPSLRPELSLWPSVYAMAVNEENAAGGRIVTAPTNGAAGIIPAVLTIFRRFYTQCSNDLIVDFLLTAAAIGMLYKHGASISGAEVGCQGEVGVACSMAAGALTAVLGGTLAQIENAAEMAMEHHLGLTCDPIGGLVQIPCIERNGVAAEKAIKLSHLALLEDGLHKKVSLDTVIKTMLKTGQDMMSIYKETSLGGLAANIIEC